MRAFVVKRGFGTLRAGVERRLGRHFLRAYLEGESLVYEAGSGDVVEKRLRVAADELLVAPAPPVVAEPRVSNILMLRLAEPLVVAPRRKVTLSLCVPVDIVAVLDDHLVDVRPSARVKYALYGSLDKGFIARIVRDSEPPCARLRVTVFNAGARPVTVTRVVFPGYMLNICYHVDEEVAHASDIVLTVLDDVGYVQPSRGEKPSDCIDAPRLLRAPILEKQRFLMLHGF